MFKVSTKGDYGLLLMTALAEHFGEGFVSLKKVAEEKNLSLAYMGHIVLPLKRAGLVESKEGILGGYRLKKLPAEISMLDILSVLIGPIGTVKCTKDAPGTCRCESGCSVKHTWQDATALLANFLGQKTLADLAGRPGASSSSPSSSSSSKRISNVTFIPSAEH